MSAWTGIMPSIGLTSIPSGPISPAIRITFDGILSPGEVAQAYVEYTARASDPVVMDYRWNARGTFPSIGFVCDQDTGSTNNLTSASTAHNISVDLTASSAVEVATRLPGR